VFEVSNAISLYDALLFGREGCFILEIFNRSEVDAKTIAALSG
jgi:hypothetical protein